MTRLIADIVDHRLLRGQYGPFGFGNWGFEASDRQSFLTLSETSRHVGRTEDVFEFAEGSWRLEYHTIHDPDHNLIRITARLTALRDGILQDGVIRLVFDRNGIDSGTLAGRTYRHRNSGRYRLFATRHVALSGGDHQIDITLDHADGAGRFDPYMYLRDEGDFWIVHARMLPSAPQDVIWLRWANRLFTVTAPEPVARFLWQNRTGKALLWRLRERWGRHAPEIQAVPLNILRRGQSLQMEVTCRFR
ncbi:MAG: hypothetical protein ABID63_11135 [Pseudomonadota bacterium]